ncbi:MAG: DUF4314 domain-containing protein [Actinobacteria bacterium]|nr:DUF4314 domain-containing protein [Actinomycetota bacterium]
MIARKRDRLVGQRVRLVFTDDKHTTLQAGDEGVVTFIDDIGTVFVDWDNGSSLGLVEDAGDRFEVL